MSNTYFPGPDGCKIRMGRLFYNDNVTKDNDKILLLLLFYSDISSQYGATLAIIWNLVTVNQRFHCSYETIDECGFKMVLRNKGRAS